MARLFCVNGCISCVKHGKIPEIPFFAVAHASNVEPDAFFGREGEAAENGPEQNSSSREA